MSGYGKAGVCFALAALTLALGACEEDPCANGACEENPCADVVCNSPPADTCADDVLTVYPAQGVCEVAAAGARCVYSPVPTNCADSHQVCEPTSSQGAARCVDRCHERDCPAREARCADGTAVNYAGALGECDWRTGECAYPSGDESQESCDAPPASRCEGEVAFNYAAQGTCELGALGAECAYGVSQSECEWDEQCALDDAGAARCQAIEPVPVAFSPIDHVIRPDLRMDPGVRVLESDQAWLELLRPPHGGVSPPVVEAGTAHVVVFPGEFKMPWSYVSVDAIHAIATHWVIDVTVYELNGCDPLLLPAPVATAVAVSDLAAAAAGSFEIRSTVEPLPCAGSVVEGMDCSLAAPCAPGLRCQGTHGTGAGICRGLDAAAGFSFTGAQIPDADPAGLLIPIEVSGLRSVPEDVQLTLTIDHPAPEQLNIALLNPGATPGGSYVALVRENEPGSAESFTRHHYVFGIPGDESANGTWHLHVVDQEAGTAGAIVGGTLAVYTRWD